MNLKDSYIHGGIANSKGVVKDVSLTDRNLVLTYADTLGENGSASTKSISLGDYLLKTGDSMTGRLVADKGFKNLLIGKGTAGVNNSGVYTPVKWIFDTGVTLDDGDIFTI